MWKGRNVQHSEPLRDVSGCASDGDNKKLHICLRSSCEVGQLDLKQNALLFSLVSWPSCLQKHEQLVGRICHIGRQRRQGLDFVQCNVAVPCGNATHDRHNDALQDMSRKRGHGDARPSCVRPTRSRLSSIANHISPRPSSAADTIPSRPSVLADDARLQPNKRLEAPKPSTAPTPADTRTWQYLVSYNPLKQGCGVTCNWPWGNVQCPCVPQRVSQHWKQMYSFVFLHVGGSGFLLQAWFHVITEDQKETKAKQALILFSYLKAQKFSQWHARAKLFSWLFMVTPYNMGYTVVFNDVPTGSRTWN